MYHIYQHGSYMWQWQPQTEKIEMNHIENWGQLPSFMFSSTVSHICLQEVVGMANNSVNTNQNNVRYHICNYIARCTVRVFKIDAAIRNAFPKCVCGATPPQTGRLLPRIGKFFPKNRKASSEERWVRTHISFRNAVQLRLRIFRVRV